MLQQSLGCEQNPRSGGSWVCRGEDVGWPGGNVFLGDRDGVGLPEAERKGHQMPCYLCDLLNVTEHFSDGGELCSAFGTGFPKI